MIAEQCKGVHCVDLGESFPTSIYLQNLASIQPRTSLVKFARSPRTDPSGSTPGEGGIIPFNPQGEMEDTGSAPPWYRRIFCCANEAGTTGGETVALTSP